MAVGAEQRIAPPRATRDLLVVVNGNASGVTGAGAWRDVFASVGGRRPEVIVTRNAAELAAAWPSAPDRRVVLVGGDGTLHAAANLPVPAREVALVPAGRANNVARSLGVPVDPRRAAELAVLGQATPIDLIEADAAGRRYVVVEGVSVGFLAMARSRYHARNSGAVTAAVRAGGAALVRFHPLAVEVRHDGRTEALRLAQLFVANLPLYEFGLRVAPHADPADRTLDFIGIEGRGRVSIPGMIARLRRGAHLGRAGVHVWRARTARIATHGASPIVADSTNLGFGPVTVRALPAALRIVAPVADGG